jgi:hypothetical protein
MGFVMVLFLAHWLEAFVNLLLLTKNLKIVIAKL